MGQYVTYKEQIERARNSGIYEPLRERVQSLLDQGFTRSEIARIMKMGKSKTELVVATLGLQVGRGRRPQRTHDVDFYEDLARQRAQEHHWVTCFQQAYGIIGKGFSTA